EIVEDAEIRAQAVARVEQLLAQGTEPAGPSVWMQLGRIAELRGDVVTARKQYAEAVRQEPWRWEWHLHLVELLDQQGERSAALKQVETALTYAPDQPRLKAAQARLLQRPDLPLSPPNKRVGRALRN